MSQNSITLLTAPGTSAIAVVRLSGPGVDAFLNRRFSKSVKSTRCVYGLLRDGEKIIDDIVAVRFAEGVDLNLHGGNWVIRSVMELAQRDGFEVSGTSPSDGKTEIWREVLTALPQAKTVQAVRLLLAQPDAWEQLPTEPDLVQKILDDRTGQWLTTTPTVAIVGPPNVGKSTLANHLFGQARSITADLPGTTRDWVGEIANIDGLAVLLVDTPGQRVTDDAIESAAIAASIGKIRSADLVIVVLDQSLPLDAASLANYPDAVRVANKSDSMHAWEAAPYNALETVAVQGIGVDQLRATIHRRLGYDDRDSSRIRRWTDRQRAILVKRLGV